MNKFQIAIIAGIALASPVHASVTVETSDVVTNASNKVGFEASGGSLNGINPFIEDGVTVRYVKDSTNVTISTSYFYPEGDRGWYVNGGNFGFTEISLVGLAEITSIDFLASHGWGSATSRNLLFQILHKGNIISSGLAGTFLGGSGNGSSFGFTGVFDTVRLQATETQFTTFSASNYEALALDRIRINSAVPEPATWAMLLLGFGFIGATMRATKRRQKHIFSYS